MRTQGTVLAVVLAVGWQPVRGAFLDGVEPFDGTVKDTVTWEEYVQPPLAGTTGPNAEIVQDDALTIVGYSEEYMGYADYTTTSVQVGVGQAATVEVTINEVDSPSILNALFYLTTNTGGTDCRSLYDSHYLGINFGALGGRLSSVYGYGDSQSHGYSSLSQFATIDVGTTYTYRIDRLTSDLARYSVLSDEGDELGSVTKDFSSLGVPDDLYLSLGAGGASVTFDNVTVIPEPATVGLLMVGSLVGFLRRVRPVRRW